MKSLIYLNELRAGSGEVGEVLLAKFLLAFLQAQDKPEYVICVNEAVRLSCERSRAGYSALKELENAGIKVLSCGTCLDAYKLTDKLSIGVVSNAIEIANLLSSHKQITL